MKQTNGEILAIDQGTTNTKVLRVNPQGEIVGRASCPLEVTYPRPGWVEQDPQALWQSVCDAMERCLADGDPSRLTAIAITNQRESVVLWERASGKALGPCVVWQCRRTAPFCQTLRERGLEPLLHEKTGLTIDPLFSASKMHWLLDQIPNGYQRGAAGELCLGTVDSWLLWNLTGGKVHACDMSNASRTQLLNLHTRRWDEELLELFEIPAAALPQVLPSSAIYGESAPAGPLPGGIPIAAMIGDSHAALFGHTCFRPGAIKATYGTGSSLMMPVDRPLLSASGLSTTVAWAMADQATYALEGNIPVTGAAVQWLGQFLGLDDPAAGVARLASQVDGSDGVYFVPAFVGLGAPHWHEEARGLITGLTRGSSAAQLARATLESIAYQIRDVFDAMEREVGRELPCLLADGGASQNQLLMQFQADIIGRPVLRSTSPDLSALGTAYLAGLTTGIWRSPREIGELPRHYDVFAPQMTAERREELYAGWRRAVARTIYTP
ncbi:glycerol kinase [Litorilinea aerophila]|uniref:ATP:glycerol 3-phosphotransferase n=1 Tax=Litorilinea aerophila TaxID=1204385 RepID=A0A540VGJ0_9CHLR|nr:glycerol kinase [Litorilinea aerophila]MCC9076569.1 glycerol kinase [Litorilinea aerophila]